MRSNSKCIYMFLWAYFLVTISVMFLYVLINGNFINKHKLRGLAIGSNVNHINRPYLKYEIVLNNTLDCINDKSRVKVKFESVNHLRRSHTTAQEMFNYLSIILNKTETLNKTTKNIILEEVSDIKNVLQLEIENATKLLKVDQFKETRLRQISEFIFSKVDKLQNPPKQLCDQVPKIICELSIDAGFASGVHEILWCLVSAYYNNQTVILISDWDKYFEQEKWNNVFIPLSKTCDYTQLPVDQRTPLPRRNTVIERKLINYLPKNIGPDLMNLLDSPNSWFHSQFIGYIMRPQPRLEKFLQDFKRQINYRHPIVGIHVRRSDKLQYKEASFHPLSDYMLHVKDYFDKLQLTEKVSQRLVYVASDDPSVLPTLIKEYPNYEFIGSTSIAKQAAEQNTRYTNSSLWGVLSDVFMLSESDYIVCTFSSSICLLSYELMQFKQIDASLKYRSLDVPFHYHYALTPIRTALYNHSPKSEEQWAVKIGDQFHERIPKTRTDWFYQAINGRGWDSYFYSSNSSENQKIL